jgi:hypothetical protein
MRSVVLVVLLVAGCAVRPPPPQAAGPRPAEMLSALSVGKHTKAQVRAALGEAVIVDFASGYEVWVYRERLPEKSAVPAGELVLLFDPAGILAKARVR